MHSDLSQPPPQQLSPGHDDIAPTQELVASQEFKDASTVGEKRLMKDSSSGARTSSIDDSDRIVQTSKVPRIGLQMPNNFADRSYTRSSRRERLRQNTNVVTPVPSQNLEPTQQLSPKELASTQILTPSQELEPAQDTRIGMFGRSSAAGLKPISNPINTVLVKRSFTDLVRLGLKKRGRTAGYDTAKMDDALTTGNACSVPLVDAEDKRVNIIAPVVASASVELADERERNLSPDLARLATPKTGASAALESMLGADTTGERSGGIEQSRRSEENQSVENIIETEDDSTVRNLAKEFSPKGCKEEGYNVREFLRRQLPEDSADPDLSKPRVDESAVPENHMIHASIGKNPLFVAIIEERAMEGARRVAAAEKLAQQLAQRQKAMAEVYRALSAFF